MEACSPGSGSHQRGARVFLPAALGLSRQLADAPITARVYTASSYSSPRHGPRPAPPYCPAQSWRAPALGPASASLTAPPVHPYGQGTKSITTMSGESSFARRTVSCPSPVSAASSGRFLQRTRKDGGTSHWHRPPRSSSVSNIDTLSSRFPALCLPGQGCLPVAYNLP